MSTQSTRSQRIQKSLLLLVTTGLIVIILAYTFSNPASPEQFSQLYILGPDRLATDYFPNNDANLTIGASMSWIIGVHNHMATPQNIELRVKLGNDTLSGPNQLTCTPAPLPVLETFTLTLDTNTTREQPITWQIIDGMKTNQQQQITIRINDRQIESPITAQEGVGFRMIIELWTLDPSSEEYRFGWSTTSEPSCAWTQLWFNVTEPT